MKDSYFFGLLRQDSKLQKAFENSLIFCIIAHSFTGFFGFLTKVFNKIGGNESFLYKKLVSPLLDNYHRVVGAVLFLIMVVPHGYWQNMYGLLGGVALALLYMLKVICKPSEARFKPVFLPVMLFCLAVIMGFLISPDKSGAMRVAIFYVTGVLLMLSVINGVDTRKKMQETLWIVWAGLMVTALYAVYQGIVGVEVDLTFVDVNTSGGTPGRVYSTFENPNNYAELIAMAFPFCIALGLSCKRMFHRVLVLGSLLLPALAIALTYSRSGWMALGVAIVVFLLLYKPILIVPMVLLGLAAIPFLPRSILVRIISIGATSDSSGLYRTYIWQGAGKVIENYGITGIGLGPENFGLIYPSFANAAAINARHSHMLYLQTIIEMGVLGFVSVMWTVLGTMKGAWVAAKKTWATTQDKYVAYGVIAAMCGMGFMSFAEYIWYYPRVLFFFFTVLGVGGAVINIVKKEVK